MSEKQSSLAPSSDSPGCFGSILRFLFWLSIAFVVIGILLTGGLWWAATSEPIAYQKVLKAADPVVAKKAAQKLESSATVLASEVKKPGHWQAIFSQAEVNGWLATVLPEKFADHLPAGVSDPRVLFEPGRVTGFCRYHDGRVNTVVSLEVEVYLTDKKNELAVRLRSAKAGALPVPLSEVVSQVSAAARDSEAPLRWTQEDGDPVALVQLEPVERESGRPVSVDKLELREGEIYVSGETSSGALRPPQ